MNTIVVCESGWILVGQKEGDALTNAYVVRRWSNGKGIGGLAKKANKSEYVLDAIGAVEVNPSKILFEIACEW